MGRELLLLLDQRDQKDRVNMDIFYPWDKETRAIAIIYALH